MKKSRIKHFMLLFVIFPSLVGCYSLFFVDNIDNSKSILANSREEPLYGIYSNNPQDERADIVYTPIESTLNFSRNSERTIESLINATDTVEFNLKTGKERVISEPLSISNNLRTIVEPFKGIVDFNSAIESVRDEEEGGLKSSYVFPLDDREKISNVTEYPWRTICKLYIQAQDNTYYTGSGAIIDNFHVLTAGHCVYLHEKGGWAKEIIVVPGKDGAYEPFGRANATAMRAYTAWTQYGYMEHDFAVITLDRSLGNLTGWMGRQTDGYTNPVYTGSLYTAGYPGELDLGESLYFDEDVGEYANQYSHWFWMDTSRGQSGGPVWAYDGSNPYILSINTYEYRDGAAANYGTRLDIDKFNQINAWLAEDNFSAVGDKPDLLNRDYYTEINGTEIIKGETMLEIHCDVINEGTTAATSFDISFYLSYNSIISPFDLLIGSVRINKLEPFNYTTSDWMGIVPTNLPDGSYYVGWIIDSGQEIDEFDENNNYVLLSNPMIELKSPFVDLGWIFITVFIIIGVISLVSITLLIRSKRKPDLSSLNT